MDANRYVHPHAGPLAWVVDGIANSPIVANMRRKLLGRLPFPVLASDVVNVVYATWLVDARLARALAPRDAQLWEEGGLTPFTILTYRHGHFGPKLLGPFRKLFPSPLQSNWRLYLKSPLPGAPACPTVAFVKNVLDSPLYCIGTRVFSDALPSHLARSFEFTINREEARLLIDPGAGSAPSFKARFRQVPESMLPEEFTPFAASWADAVTRLTTQDAAVVCVPALQRVALATISLPADLSSIQPLQIEDSSLQCPLLQELGANEPCFSFMLPNVYFQALSERLL